jgi:hypothetical protein
VLRRFWAENSARKEQLSILAQRIAALENALGAFQANHELLKDELLGIKNPFLPRRNARLSTVTLSPLPGAVAHSPDPEEAELVQAFGSLSVSDVGHSRYVGPTVTPWFLLLVFSSSTRLYIIGRLT